VFIIYVVRAGTPALLNRTFVKNIFVFVSISLFSLPSLSQDTIKLIENDTINLKVTVTWAHSDTLHQTPQYGLYTFRDSMPDGHYMVYSMYDSTALSSELTYKNWVKNGMESRYYFRSTEKYKEVSWAGGKKNGRETHFDNQEITKQYTYRNDVLHGPCLVPGDFSGFYKNGFRDSTWQFYEGLNDYSNPQPEWLSREYFFRQGKEFLVSAWDMDSKQTAKNGTGTLITYRYGKKTITAFRDSLRNGKTISYHSDDMGPYNKASTTYNRKIVANVEFYTNDNLSGEIIHSCEDSCRLLRVSGWTWLPTGIWDTMRLDDYLLLPDNIYMMNDFPSDKIDQVYDQKRSGKWERYFPDTKKSFEGNYELDKKVGIWKMYYPDGKLKIVGDYEKNEWKHYDEEGKIASEFKGEYLTPLMEGWDLIQTLDTAVVLLIKDYPGHDYEYLEFKDDGTFYYITLSRYNPAIVRTYNYKLLGDRLSLTLILSNDNEATWRTLNYKIVNATKERIELKRLN
jgi:antitoxin component YwqK of YwqJK toxin-antitoxin module